MQKELKRIINVVGHELRTGTNPDDTQFKQTIDHVFGNLPQGVKKYEVRYRIVKKGILRVSSIRLSTNGFLGCVVRNNDDFACVCFMPHEWKGQTFNRYVKIIS